MKIWSGSYQLAAYRLNRKECCAVSCCGDLVQSRIGQVNTDCQWPIYCQRWPGEVSSHFSKYGVCGEWFLRKPAFVYVRVCYNVNPRSCVAFVVRTLSSSAPDWIKTSWENERVVREETKPMLYFWPWVNCTLRSDQWPQTAIWFSWITFERRTPGQ